MDKVQCLILALSAFLLSVCSIPFTRPGIPLRKLNRRARLYSIVVLIIYGYFMALFFVFIVLQHSS